ncbi:MAG: ABC-F type ribosomal protection protein [Oscillospiraceae bacterium]|nr:ABC-F type ribosomal protection protein [Oscillospiraceae bacterium]
MVDISVHELNKYYGANHVIKGIDFEIYSGEKVGLLGKNGSGKTTLFKILSGIESYESGAVSKANGRKIEMLDQIPVFDEKYTVEDILYLSFKEILNIYNEMKKIEGDDTPSILAKYGRLMEDYERLGGYETEVKIDKICSGMNIDETMRKILFSSLSGGEKTRVNLARILLRDCDILLLDEPTNHLDLQSLGWVEKFLNEFSGTIFVISHDRAFLDNVIDRIIEIDDGKLNFYEGNYSYYVEEKERRFLSQTELYEQQQKKIRQLETAAKRLHEWAKQSDNAKLHRRAFAIEKRIEKMDKIEKPRTGQKIAEGFGDSGFSGKEIILLNSVYKAYGGNNLLNGINLKIYRNDRIALIGANGCGKTTLVKLIINEEICDSGDVKVGNSARTAYMPQIIEFENNELTVLETLRHFMELSEERARNILAGFHFKAKDVFKKVGSLSGGEKSRLKLCLLMQNNINFLILDEPTNHLDIESREWIEDAVYDFNGTILFISHDRYFLSKFADRIWDLKNGEITEYIGGFEEYAEKISKTTDKQNTNDNNNANKQKPLVMPVNLSFKQPKKIKRFEELEKLIAETEEEIKNINIEMESSEIERDHKKLNFLYEDKQNLENTLNFMYDEWLNLSQDK